jgi:hypothetical protein
MKHETVKAPVPGEQLIYARWLDAASRTGFVVLVVAFLAYVFGMVGSHVPMQDLPMLWTLPLEDYLARTHAPTGWGFIRLLPHGEYLSLVGVVMLAMATLLCYVRLVFALRRNGERVQAGIAAAQVVVLVLAAVGVLAGGH